MGTKINIPIGTKVMVKYRDLEENSSGIIFGELTNIFNGLVGSSLDYGQEEVAGIFVEKWMENGKELEIKRNVNDKTNIFRADVICEIEKQNRRNN
ncbi:MAG: hypothetical protein C0412_12365 [Flavobacterium sp.]|nr:hypothetical protein [Flavobacterium sp.]